MKPLMLNNEVVKDGYAVIGDWFVTGFWFVRLNLCDWALQNNERAAGRFGKESYESYRSVQLRQMTEATHLETLSKMAPAPSPFLYRKTPVIVSHEFPMRVYIAAKGAGIAMVDDQFVSALAVGKELWSYPPKESDKYCHTPLYELARDDSLRAVVMPCHVEQIFRGDGLADFTKTLTGIKWTGDDYT